MKHYAIYGASGCGRSVLPLMQHTLKSDLESGAAELVFVDDEPISNMLNGYRVVPYRQWVAENASSRFINVAIANSNVRERLVQRCKEDGAQFFEVRAANVVQMDEVHLGEGAILCPFVTLTSNIKIGDHFHANLYSYVEHDCVVGNFVTFAPGVMCNGNVHIEDHVYIGAGAVIKQGKPSAPLVIGRGAIVGMGAVVTKSVAPGVTVLGNPAQQIKK